MIGTTASIKTIEIFNRMKTYRQYINEGIRDMMTPKSEEDVRRSLEKLPILKRMEYVIKNGFFKGFKNTFDELDIYNIRTDDGMTLLTLASMYGSYEVVEFLIEKGADVNLPDEFGYTALMRALGEELKSSDEGNDKIVTVEEYIRVVKILLDNGADVNLKNSKSLLSPLHYAVRSGNEVTVKMLLKRGADINVKDKWGISPLDNNHNGEGIKALFDKYGNGINEGIRDKMIPKSKEDIDKVIDKIFKDVPDLKIFNWKRFGFIPVLFQNRHTLYSFKFLSPDDIEWYLIIWKHNGSMELRTLPSKGNIIKQFKTIDEIENYLEDKFKTGESTDEFINEGIRDMMTPKSDDDIKKKLNDMSIENFLKMCKKHNLKPTNYRDIADIKRELNHMSIEDFLEVCKKHDFKPIDYREIGDIKKKLNDMSIEDFLEVCKKYNLEITDYRDIDDIKKKLTETPIDEVWKLCKKYNMEITDYLSIDEIKELLKNQFPNLKLRSGLGTTSFMWAVRYGHTEIVNLLINRGMDVNVKDKGRTALGIASMWGHTEVVKLLIKSGADVNMKDKRGITPLMLASEKGRNEIVVILLKNGADVNISCKYEWTALMYASKGKIEAVNILIKNGTNVNTKTKYGHTPLMVSVQNNNIHIAELLIKSGADVNGGDDHGRTVLMDAAGCLRIEIVNMLIKRGADVNIRDTFGDTALTYAIRNKGREIINLLKKYGARV